jgi:hypothetical protein
MRISKRYCEGATRTSQLILGEPAESYVIIKIQLSRLEVSRNLPVPIAHKKCANLQRQ